MEVDFVSSSFGNDQIGAHHRRWEKKVLDKKYQWYFENGYVEESAETTDKNVVYFANEKYSARLRRSELGYSIIALHEMEQAGREYRSHLFATSTTAAKDGSVLFFPDLLARGDLVVSSSETEGDVQTVGCDRHPASCS